MLAGWVGILLPFTLVQRIVKYKLLHEDKQSGLVDFGMDTGTATELILGDGAVESDGFSSTGMLVSPIIPVGMKMRCKCTATENGTMCAKIGKDLRCMNSHMAIDLQRFLVVHSASGITSIGRLHFVVNQDFTHKNQLRQRSKRSPNQPPRL